MTAGKPGLLLEPKERLRFETLIADLSSEFVNLPSASVDRRIEDAQRRVCECLGLEQSTLWECSVEAPHTFTLTHLYRSQGGPPTLEPMEASECFPWCQRQALAGKVIAVSSMEDLPTEASRDRETWLHYGIKSNLTLPLSAGGGPTIGALSFGTVRAERTWPESIVKRLQLVSQVFANALVGKRAEEASRIEEKRLRSVVRITQQKATSLRELLDKALEEAIALSDSKLGYIYYYNEGQQEFTLHAWSREAMEECAIPNPPTVYRLDKTGLWGEAVRQRRPIVVNDFSAPNPLKKGYPPGHAPLFRYMTLPVLCDGHIVAVVGVANRARDYTEMDVQQLTMMMDSVWEVAERKRAEEAVRVLAGKLLTAQEAERSLIAREMHDDLTQRIAVLAIEAGKLEQASAASESLSGRLREMKGQLIRLSQDVHALSRQLHPSILDDLGLVDALRSECASFSQREGIAVRYTPQDIPAGIPKEVALCLYRIAQEALRNIAKHSRAREASVSLAATDDCILLSIEDTGIGFSANHTRGELGLGLDSMEERARLIGAELAIRSEAGRGTAVEVWAPYSGKAP